MGNVEQFHLEYFYSIMQVVIYMLYGLSPLEESVIAFYLERICICIFGIVINNSNLLKLEKYSGLQGKD